MILTSKRQYSKKCKDGKKRNFILYFLNDILILKLKIPFNTEYELGYDRVTGIYDTYLLNNNLYQKRKILIGCISESNFKIRDVSFPVSKKILKQFEIEENIKINLD